MSCRIEDIKILNIHIDVNFLTLRVRGRNPLLARNRLVLAIARITRRDDIFGLMMRFFRRGSKVFILGELEIFLAEVVRDFDR